MLNITITINGNVSPEDLAKIAVLVKGYDPYHHDTAQAAPVEDTPAEKPKREAKPKAADPKVVEEQEVEPAGEPDADVPTQAQVVEVAQALVKAQTREVLEELVKSFGAASLSKIPEGSRADFIAQAKAKID
jgi:hypothetical protein